MTKHVSDRPEVYTGKGRPADHIKLRERIFVVAAKVLEEAFISPVFEKVPGDFAREHCIVGHCWQ